MTRRQVTVALNGDGGDEAFGGYTRYVANSLAGRLDSVPFVLRRPLAALGSEPAGRRRDLQPGAARTPRC